MRDIPFFELGSYLTRLNAAMGKLIYPKVEDQIKQDPWTNHPDFEYRVVPLHHHYEEVDLGEISYEVNGKKRVRSVKLYIDTNGILYSSTIDDVDTLIHAWIVAYENKEAMSIFPISRTRDEFNVPDSFRMASIPRDALASLAINRNRWRSVCKNFILHAKGLAVQLEPKK